MRSQIVLFFTFGCIISDSISKNSIPSYVTLCKQSDPDLDNCVLNSIKTITPYLAKGIPEMRIAALDPFKISKIMVNGGNNLEIEFNEVVLWNILAFKAKNTHLDLKTPQIDLDIYFPKIELRSNYKIRGRILMFDLNGSGYCTVNLTNSDVSAKLKADTKQKNGKEFFDFNRINLDVKMDDFKVQFDNLFEGNKELTENTNTVINENSKALVPEFNSLLSSSLKSIIMSIVKNVFDSFPLEELVPK